MPIASPTPKEGDKAPDFTVKDDQGNQVKLSALKGKKVVLYFYPKDDTPGCTVEACAFRDLHQKIQKKAVVFGVSRDDEKSHKKFIDKYELPFRLLCDTDSKIVSAYGVLQEKSLYGRKYMGIARTTFVIGEDGRIEKLFPNVKPQGHAEEVFSAL